MLSGALQVASIPLRFGWNGERADRRVMAVAASIPLRFGWNQATESSTRTDVPLQSLSGSAGTQAD
jgi:hypothetical protein